MVKSKVATGSCNNDLSCIIWCI